MAYNTNYFIIMFNVIKYKNFNFMAQFTLYNVNKTVLSTFHLYQLSDVINIILYLYYKHGNLVIKYVHT